MIFKMQTMQRRWYQHLSYAAMGAGSGERGFLRFIESWERGQIFDKHRRCGFDVDSMYVLDVWWCFGCLEAEQNSKTLAVSWVLVMPVMPVMPLKLAWCGLLTARFSRPVWWKWFAWRQGWCRGNGWSYPQSTSRAFSEWLDMDPNMVRYLEVTTFHPISIDFPKLQRCFFFSPARCGTSKRCFRILNLINCGSKQLRPAADPSSYIQMSWYGSKPWYRYPTGTSK